MSDNKNRFIVIYVEVGNMDNKQVQLLVTKINELYKGSDAGQHYIVPVRFGKLNTDVLFSQEFLSIVRSVCTVQDGKIVLKPNYGEVEVKRQFIDKSEVETI